MSGQTGIVFENNLKLMEFEIKRLRCVCNLSLALCTEISLPIILQF